MSSKEKKVVYVINSLNPGGAEVGLELLLNNGLFECTDFYIVCLSRSFSDLEDRIVASCKNKVTFLSSDPVSNKKIANYAVLLHRSLREIKPEIVITSLSQSVLAVRLIKVLHRFKHITFEHNTQFKNRSAWHLLKVTDGLSDLFWCDSTATQKALLARKPGANNVIVPLFYVNNTAPRKSNYDINTTFRLMATGRLMAQKNYPLLIHVIQLLSEQGFDVTLDIYGEGELSSELVQLTNACGISEKISFKGFVRQWLSEAHTYDAYILLSDFEGLSIATLEAMSVGMPCIVKPVGELANYISDRVNGLRVSTDEEIVTAIKQLIANNELRMTLGKNAKNYVAQHYSDTAFKKLIQQAKRTLE